MRLLPLLICLLAGPAIAQTAAPRAPGPASKEGETRREQIWHIPAPGGSPLMIATVMRPPGETRHPLVVINHAEPVDAALRSKIGRPRYVALGTWFVDHGYVVVQPLRRGYGSTGGTYAEDYGACASPDYHAAGLATAADIKATIDYMRTQPFVAPDRTIVVGNDAGGWGTIAYSSLNPPNVAGMVNFAGGRGGHQKLPNGNLGNCLFAGMIQAAAKYGSTARVPTLWIYAENDTFYRPAAMKRVAEAYMSAGGKAVFKTTPPLPPEGHSLAASDAATSLWAPPLEEFLNGLK